MLIKNFCLFLSLSALTILCGCASCEVSSTLKLSKDCRLIGIGFYWDGGSILCKLEDQNAMNKDLESYLILKFDSETKQYNNIFISKDVNYTQDKNLIIVESAKDIALLLKILKSSSDKSELRNKAINALELKLSNQN